MTQQDSLCIKDLDPGLRPQERALKHGVATLETSDLLALILRTGQPGMPITEITRSLIHNAGGSLHLLGRKSITELMKTKGMGTVRALQVAAIMELSKRYFSESNNKKQVIFRHSKDIDNYIRPYLASLAQEEIWLITLRRNNSVINRYFLTRGSATASIFDLKRCIKTALLDEAECIVLCHNHPSGNLRPSPSDDSLTKNLAEAVKTLDLRLLDHLIISHNGYYSYSDEGRL